MTDVQPLAAEVLGSGAALLPELGEVPSADLQDRLAGWLSDFTSLQEHLELLARADGPAGTLDALLDSGAALLGARRGLVVTLRPGPARTLARPVGLGLDPATLGSLETVPAEYGPFAELLDPSGATGRLLVPDLATDPTVGPRFREIAARLGLAACYALPLATERDGVLGAAAWFYDEPGRPDQRREQLARRYCEFAAPLLASFVTGVTEPIEYSFAYVAPLLYGVHALLTGA
ncbi:hypothetical protein ACWEMJ_27660, partial [Kitasatospora sp. NPDC004531]